MSPQRESSSLASSSPNSLSMGMNSTFFDLAEASGVISFDVSDWVRELCLFLSDKFVSAAAFLLLQPPHPDIDIDSINTSKNASALFINPPLIFRKNLSDLLCNIHSSGYKQHNIRYGLL